MKRTYLPQAALAGLMTAGFAGCSLPTGKYAQVHYDPATGSRFAYAPQDVDPALSTVSATTVGVTIPNPLFRGNGGNGAH